MHKENHPYAKEWEYDTTSREGKEKYAKLLNLELEKELEKRIKSTMSKKYEESGVSLEAGYKSQLFLRQLIKER